MADKQSVQVTIFHQTYTLRTAGDDGEIQELADTVDQLMSTIAAKSPNADGLRIAVLACLHLADKLRTLERDVDRKAERCRMLLDRLLDH